MMIGMISPTLRLATAADLPAINTIYNHYVLHSNCTYQEEPETLEDRHRWFTRRGPGHPVTVVQLNGHVVGWGALSSFHSRAAYQHTVENSVYVHHEHHRRGLGSILLEDLIQRAEGLGHHAIIAGIDAGQIASIALHEKYQFQHVGHFREVGFKFGHWLDVVYMQLTLLQPA